ncbi:MAG: chemotaxis protein CheX [Spirochaetia bacterium]|nr:chemotaxis protein CheX [Spirochaetia bacterium]
MTLDYINAFTTSFYDFLKNEMGTESTKGKLQIKNPMSPIKGVAILVGISGELSGNILIEMDKATAHRLSAKMNQEPSEEVNDLFIATIKEFGNLVCGGAVVRLDKLNKDFNLSPPTVILGEHMILALESKTEILLVPFLSDLGQIDLNIFVDLKASKKK